MKLTKSAYLSLLLLSCFLVSFSTNIYKNIYFSPTKLNLKNQSSLMFSAKESGLATTTDFLFEKNETETENSFQAQVFLLPSFLSNFQYQVVQTSFISSKSLVEKLTNPIYISYCNIRI